MTMTKRGFTLIEVIVAILLFAIATLCGMSFLSFGNNIMMRAREQSYALFVSEREMARCEYKCVSGCEFSGEEPGSPVTNEYYFPQVGVTYRTEFSWEKVNTPYGGPIGGAPHPYYDWYKLIFVTTTWNSKIDHTDRTMSFHTVGVMGPRHDDH